MKRWLSAAHRTMMVLAPSPPPYMHARSSTEAHKPCVYTLSIADPSSGPMAEVSRLPILSEGEKP